MATAKQIAARKAFAALAKSGALQKLRKKAAPRRKRNPGKGMPEFDAVDAAENPIDEASIGKRFKSLDKAMYYARHKALIDYENAGSQASRTYFILKSGASAYTVRDYTGGASVVSRVGPLNARELHVLGYRSTDFDGNEKRRRNPEAFDSMDDTGDAAENPQPLKMKIRGSETPDHPEGLIVTEKQALAFARKNMPADLKRAGFVASVFPGARGWSINYGASVPGHSSYRAKNPVSIDPGSDRVALNSMDDTGDVAENPSGRFSIVSPISIKKPGFIKIPATGGQVFEIWKQKKLDGKYVFEIKSGNRFSTLEKAVDYLIRYNTPVRANPVSIDPGSDRVALDSSGFQYVVQWRREQTKAGSWNTDAGFNSLPDAKAHAKKLFRELGRDSWVRVEKVKA